MIHTNGARIYGDTLQIDRKFHVGMQSYVEKIPTRIVSVHPESVPGRQTIDLVEIPIKELGYDVITLKPKSRATLASNELTRLEDQIAKSCFVYGYGLSGSRLARKRRVPYILNLEYDLLTEIITTTTEVTNLMRRGARAVHCTLKYATQRIPDMRQAHSLHCNGFPVYDESKLFNPNRLLYFDSRMSKSLIISRDALERRLSRPKNRPLRLLFTGRYEPMKGADDAIRVGIECLRRGLDVELHCYGQGSLRPEMDRLATQSMASAKIQIHDAIPFPQLVNIARTFDVFISCHIQNDPSCTYLESFGSGLPIVGYGNRMWLQLKERSNAGLSSPLKNPQAMVENIQRLASDRATFTSMSEKARSFAFEHCFEHEFAKRTDALNEAIDRLPAKI